MPGCVATAFPAFAVVLPWCGIKFHVAVVPSSIVVPAVERRSLWRLVTASTLGFGIAAGHHATSTAVHSQSFSIFKRGRNFSENGNRHSKSTSTSET